MLKHLATCALLWAAPATAQPGDIQIIGDSTMAWNGGLVAQHLAQLLDQKVEDRSVSGARISHPDFLARFTGMDISRQLDARSQSWVILTGGANDLGAECGCTRCDAVLDDLITADGQSGEIPHLITEALDAGARVIYAVYYDDPVGGGPFSACADEFAVLETRMAQAARHLPGLTLVDMGAAMDAANPADYDPDRIHPSRRASRAIAALLAQAITTAQ